MRKVIAATIFWAVQIVWLPLAVLAYVPFVVRMVRFSRRTGTSATVLASLYARYMMHGLGTRRDEAGARLMRAMPNVSPVGLWLTTSGAFLAHRLTGYVPRTYRYPYEGELRMIDHPAARTTLYDQVVARYATSGGAGGARQLVILGAGFDTRAYRLPAETLVCCFEVDAPKTQAFKREMLQKAGVDASRVTFVSADFLVEDWMGKLVAAGFDPAAPSLFTWEAVTMYLDRESVESSLRRIAGTAAGSVVAFDYFSAELLESRSLFMRYSRAIIRATGEPWRFGIDNTPPAREQVAEFVAGCGLRLEEQRNFGLEGNGKRAVAGFAVAVVPETGKQ